MSKKIFILHGWTYSLAKWTELCVLLKEQGLDPVQLKVPGLTEPSKKEWTIDGYVEWLRSKLDREAEPIVVGHSNGGRISLAYINKYPNHIKKLILIDSAGIPHESSVPKTKLKVLRLMSKVGKPMARIPLVKRVFYKVIGAGDYLHAPDNMKKTMQNMLAADENIDLTKVTIPVTIIWGSQDKTTPLKDGRTMQKRITGSQLHIVNGAKHSPQGTHPEEVAKHILEAIG